MSWETVNLAVRFWSAEDTWDDFTNSPNSGIPFTPDEQNEIRQSLHQLYDESSYARALLESGASGGQYINFVQTDPGIPGGPYPAAA